jgi:UDP-glucose 4-epimerase
MPTDQVQVVEGSTLDRELVRDLCSGVDSCFHLASAVGVRLILDQPLDSFLQMVRGTDTVFETASETGTRVVFASTSEVYGKNEGGNLSEDADRVVGPPSKARWSYATAKALGEILAHGYSRERGSEMVIARLFNAVGPRQTGTYGMVLPRFVRQALSGEELTVYGDGTQSRCFTHVRDAVDGLVGLMDEGDATGLAFNVGSENDVTIIDLARRVLERSGSDSAVRLVPYEEAYAGDDFEELGDRRPDCSALRELTGWTATRTVDDAIDDVIAHERESLAVQRA